MCHQVLSDAARFALDHGAHAARAPPSASLNATERLLWGSPTHGQRVQFQPPWALSLCLVEKDLAMKGCCAINVVGQ